MTREIPESLVLKIRAWLGPDGIAFFTKLKKKHGEINVVLEDGGIPHPVHFREGMQVRNAMRREKECEEWTDHDFDDNWIAVVERAIESDGHRETGTSSS